jgi:RimJ/RimL family protein N-acetyltransferase
MNLPITKEKLLEKLPFGEEPWIIRAWNRVDLDTLAAWPKYPFPYEGFEFSFVSLKPTARDELYDEKNQKPDTVPLILDHNEHPAIGYLSLIKINWVEARVGNIGFRVHPEWVNKEIGTTVLRMICLWCFECGISSIRVDVAASNSRAVRCYEKVGFSKIDEIWREAQDLKGVELCEKGYDFLRPHLRLDDNMPTLRFFFMEVSQNSIR